jgi:molybdopterin molybdotransferase
MPEFFNVKDVPEVLALRSAFAPVATETVPLAEALDRVLAENLISAENLPDFRRTIVDGFAVKASTTFGASDGSPGFLMVVGNIAMGERPDFAMGPGEAARIATGGMLPEGADAVVMIEHTEAMDDSAIEVYKGVAPGENVIEPGEDFAAGQTVLAAGTRLRPAEVGLLGAFGRGAVQVFRRPVVGIISTGDEVVPVDATPGPGQVRDVNSHTLAGMLRAAGAEPRTYGIIPDDAPALIAACRRAVAECDMILLSGGSSVGTRDFTIEAIMGLDDPEILVHGIAIRPGKPTILARAGQTPVWGLPGHVVSAMVVFVAIVRPFVDRLSGGDGQERTHRIPARLARNLSSGQGRVEFVRVRLVPEGDGLRAEPVLGKSGLLNTMVHAHGLVEIGRDVEGLDKGERVWVMPV